MGNWQVERLNWKNQLIATQEQRLELPPVNFSLASYNAEADHLKRVTVVGTLHHDVSLKLTGKFRHDQFGYFLVTPFTLASGETILMHRGWVPDNQEITPQSGLQNITARIYSRSEQPAWFIIQNDLQEGQWFWADIQAMTDHLNAEYKLAIQPILLHQTIALDGATYPEPLPETLEFRNDHSAICLYLV